MITFKSSDKFEEVLLKNLVEKYNPEAISVGKDLLDVITVNIVLRKNQDYGVIQRIKNYIKNMKAIRKIHDDVVLFYTLNLHIHKQVIL